MPLRPEVRHLNYESLSHEKQWEIGQRLIEMDRAETLRKQEEDERMGRNTPEYLQAEQDIFDSSS